MYILSFLCHDVAAIHVYCFYRLCICPLFFFFFKQKTAYEMRISDWSSDVCSSDLSRPALSMAGDCFVAPLLAMTKGELRAVAEIIAERVQGDMGDGKDADPRLRPNDERKPLYPNSRSM